MLGAGAVQWGDRPVTEGETLPRSMLSRKAWRDSMSHATLWARSGEIRQGALFAWDLHKDILERHLRNW